MTQTDHADVQGFFSDAEGRHYASLCRGKRVLEIGSWKGRSAIFACYGGASLVVCVDTWSGDKYTGRGTFWPEFDANIHS